MMTAIMSTLMQMFLIVSFYLCRSLSTWTDEVSCVDRRCNQTKLVKANETQSVTLLPCHCKAKVCRDSRQIIYNAWWSSNKSTPYNHSATAAGRNYSIELSPDLVTQGSDPLLIFTTYNYSCPASDRYHMLHGIKVTMTPVSAPNLSCPSNNDNTVSEGSPIVLQCSTQLLDSQMVKTVFHFRDHHRHCEADAYGDDSEWVVKRTNKKPYDCQLTITSAQLSDAGTYTCGVYIRDEELKSKQLQIKVSPSPSPSPETSNPLAIILGTAVPGGILVLAVVFFLLSTSICNIVKNRRQGRSLNDLRQRLDRLEAPPQPAHPQPALQPSPLSSCQGSTSNHSLEAAEVGDSEKTQLVSSPRPKQWMGGALRENEQPGTYGATKVTSLFAQVQPAALLANDQVGQGDEVHSNSGSYERLDGRQAQCDHPRSKQKQGATQGASGSSSGSNEEWDSSKKQDHMSGEPSAN